MTLVTATEKGQEDTKQHIELPKDAKFMGTPYFCSLPMAKSNIYSRRDDIESIIYCLAYLIKGKLPWDQDYYINEEEKDNPENEDGNEWDKILERKKYIKESDVCDRLPIDMKHLYKYAIRLKFDEEPDYDMLVKYITNMRDKSLKREGIKEINKTAHTTQKLIVNSDSQSSRMVSHVNHKSILSKVKISGVEININTISTIQQNKTLNSLNFTNCDKDNVQVATAKDMKMGRRQSTFKNSKKLNKGSPNNISSFVQNKIEESKSFSASNCVFLMYRQQRFLLKSRS